jgi:hypothetical protein
VTLRSVLVMNEMPRRGVSGMSALLAEADMLIVCINVCYVPGTDILRLLTSSLPHDAVT